MIEQAYTLGKQLGLEVWCEDEAGPFQTMPYLSAGWQPSSAALKQAHEYVRNGTAKVLTLLRPSDGQVRIKGVTSCTNAVLHPWLKQELTKILAGLPESEPAMPSERHHAAWCRWQAGLTVKFSLRRELPPLRMLLVLDNLAGHTTAEFVCWCMDQGIMLVYTPLSGSWLNMAESMQRILKRRALDGSHPRTPEEIIAWFDAVAEAWNRAPTPFEWGGKRTVRRARSRTRRHAQGGSGACTYRPVTRPRRTNVEKWQQA
ncbi:MAG: transposase [Chloroflexota bacterium]|nr:transposase [Chloroflexota bacterium]